MGVLQRFAGRLVMMPYRLISAHSEADRWIEEILRAAAIKKSTQIVIRKTQDKTSLEALVHDCGSDACATRMRQIDAMLHEDALIAVLRERTGLKAEPHRPLPSGKYEEIVMAKHMRITVIPAKPGKTLPIMLLIRYQ